ncbi:replication initiation factor domain-containing protein [Streptococcus mitis]|nr:replication initiation factor domain-containing protein [Streptococcus mitis]
MSDNFFQEMSREILKISPDEVVEKREFGERKNVINSLQNLAGPSNSRLNTQNFALPFKMNWSIDRITIVGFLKRFNFDHTIFTEDGEVIYTKGEDFTLAQAMPILARENGAIEKGRGWSLVDKYGENVAYVEVLVFKDKETDREKGRIDFNPNKIQHFLKIDLKDFIKMMFEKPHFSRADVACDIVGLPDEYISQYRLVDGVSFRPYYGQSGQLETAYWGARSSERQVRLYNKFVEQTKKKEVIPEDVKSWWRLELQLRRSRADEWVGVVYDTLGSFYSPEHLNLDLSATEKIMLTGLHANHNLWSELNKDTKRKYRKLAKEVAKEDELTNHLKSSFSSSIEQLDKELNSWLIGMNVVFEKEEIKEL